MRLEPDTEIQRASGTGRTRKLGQLPLRPEVTFAVPHAFPASGRSEESDNYGEVVAVLDPKFRVIRSRCGLQWIAQRQNGKRNGAAIWTSFAYCGTKEGLLLRLPKAGHGCDPKAWAVIEALPDLFPKRAKAAEFRAPSGALDDVCD
jgi:hypothetical protein